MSEERLRLVRLRVVGGEFAGRSHSPEEVVSEVLVGSDPDCHLVIDAPGVSPIHARLWTDLDEAKVNDTRAPRGVYVNDALVSGEAALRPGDALWLGPPGDPESVRIECVFEPWVEVLPAAVLADGADDETLVEAEVVEVVDEPQVFAQPELLQGEGGQPSASDEVVDAVPVETFPSEPAPAEPAPAEPAPIASTPVDSADDPFFVGEEPPRFPQPPAVPVVEEIEEELQQGPAPEPLEPPVEEAFASSASDEWAIEASEFTPEPPAPPVETDEFYVAEEPPVAPAPALARAEAPAVPAPEKRAEAHPVRVELPPPVVPISPPIAAPPPVEEVVPLAPPAAAPVLAPPATFLEIPAPPVAPAPAAPITAPAAPVAPAAAPAQSTPQPPSSPPPRRPPTASAPVRPPSTAPRRPSPRPQARRRPAGPPAWVRPVALGVGALALVAGIGYGAWTLLGGVRLESIEPSRVRAGQRATLVGRGFAAEAAGNFVLFDDVRAKVLSASPTRLEVEVPDARIASGSEASANVVVRIGSSTSRGLPVVVLQGPRLHGLSPQAALPGEEVLLAGAGWGLGATVRFGPAPAEVRQADASAIRAVVPELPIGASAPVVVTIGGVESNPAPFVVGRVPVVTGVLPASAAPGDLVKVSGLGFHASGTEVRVAGSPALVVAANSEAVEVVVPRVPAGDPARALELRVPGTSNVGQAVLTVAPAPDPVDLRFVAEPFSAVAGRPHAVVATPFGPAFVLAASGGRSSAARALEAQKRLNDALPALRTTVGLEFEARGLDGTPSIGLAGRQDPLVEVTAEDAAAYNEDWTGLRGRGGAVTPARLARWWEAVARDLVLLGVRGERPRFAAALAPEGRVLGQLYDAARRGGGAGVARALAEAPPRPIADGLRVLALRVPPSVAAAAPAVAGGPLTTPTPAIAPLRLSGTFRGSESEEGQLRYLTVSFARGGGSVSYEGGITFTVPILSLSQPRRDEARFSVQMRGGVRHYTGKWDGERLAGPISTDAAGRNVVARFELRPR